MTSWARRGTLEEMELVDIVKQRFLIGSTCGCRTGGDSHRGWCARRHRPLGGRHLDHGDDELREGCRYRKGTDWRRQRWGTTMQHDDRSFPGQHKRNLYFHFWDCRHKRPINRMQTQGYNNRRIRRCPSEQFDDRDDMGRRTCCSPLKRANACRPKCRMLVRGSRRRRH